jgi:hypothetical protein
MKHKCDKCGKRVPRQYAEAHKRFHAKPRGSLTVK